MKVLWFTTSPVSAANRIVGDFIGESWIGALEREIVKERDIELGIVFNSNVQKTEKHKINEVTYYITPRRSGRHKRKYLFGYKYTIDDSASLDDYIKVIDDFNPNLLHIFGSESNYGLIISKINIPALLHIQGNITVINKKYHSGISKLELLRYSKWKDILRGSSLLHQYKTLQKIGKRELIVYENCRYFLGRTKWDRSIVKILAPHARYFHCDELLRNEFYEAEWKQSKDSMIKLISVSRGGVYKGLETIMETATLLSDLSANFQWFIVGESRDNKVPQIFERKYKKSFSSVNVKFVGSKNVDQLIELLEDSSIFVHPSHIENSPNVVCESMAIGLPVIATSVGGTSSILTDNSEGILVQDGDPYALAGAIIELWDNKSLQIQFSINSRTKAFVRHDPKRIVNDLKQIYKEVIHDYVYK